MFNGFVALTDETESGKKKKKMEKGSNGIQFSSQSAGSLSDRSNKSLVFFLLFFFFCAFVSSFETGSFDKTNTKKNTKKKRKKNRFVFVAGPRRRFRLRTNRIQLPSGVPVRLDEVALIDLRSDQTTTTPVTILIGFRALMRPRAHRRHPHALPSTETRYNSVQLGTTRYNSVQLGKTRYNSVQLGKTR